ncbi:MAG: hypothetical protein FJ030_10895 [Chloroflexi bacterium]|nr:hypothetical protein [Chloroflexota bacterium]
MTTTAQTWFFHPPEKNAYLISERVRTNFWGARFGGVWLDVVRVGPPILMAGAYQGSAIELEWQPAQWCALRAKPAAASLPLGVSNMLGLKPAIKYEEARGYTVWEWLTGDVNARWQAVQGKPEYAKLERLK